jgi:hypothetical protein
MFTSVILILLPISQGVYDFQTDLREDNFTVITALATTNTTVQLFKPLYDDDTSTIDIYSHDADDSPLYSSYNGTTRALVITGLAENTTRVIDVTYDIDAITDSDSLSTFLSYLPFIWILMWIALPIAGIIAIWTGRA